MPRKNQPGCGPCCAKDVACVDTTGGVCPGERLNPPEPCPSYSYLFKWFPTDGVYAAQWLPHDGYLGMTHEEVLALIGADWTECANAGGTITGDPYGPDFVPEDPDEEGITSTFTCSCAYPDEEEPRYSGAGCLKCLPRYKCASVTFTPGAYSDLCPNEFQSKLWYFCTTNPSWGSAAGPEGSLGIAVELYRSPTDNECSCYYRVSLAIGEDTETFEHIPMEELTETLFTLTTADGDYDVTIGSADVVTNPLALVPCSPCICTTCLPRKLLITVTGLDACDESVSQCTSTLFNCDAYETATVSMQFGDMVIDITTTDPSENTCSLDVVISGIEARASDLQFKIMLETGPQKAPGDDCDPVSLYECRELPDAAEPDSFFSQGFKSQGDCHGWMKAAMIDHTATIMSVDELTQLCTVRIQDASCADCQPVSVRCPGGCKSLDRIPVEGSMCAPPDIVATFIHESCEDIDGYTFDMSGWPGTGFGEHAFQTVSPIIVNRCSYASTNHFGAYLLDFSLPCVDHDPPEDGQCGPAYYTVEAVLVFETPECEGDLPESPMLYRLHLEISATCTAYGPNPFYTYLILSPDAETASCSPFLLDFTLPSWASLHDRIPCCDTEGSFKLRLTL